MKHLEDYYSGDAAWLANAEWAKEYWVGSELQKTLLQRLNNDFELAAMVYAQVGNDCLEWLDTRVPALSGRKPINCLSSRNLVLRLREALMRMD